MPCGMRYLGARNSKAKKRKERQEIANAGYEIITESRICLLAMTIDGLEGVSLAKEPKTRLKYVRQSEPSSTTKPPVVTHSAPTTRNCRRRHPLSTVERNPRLRKQPR